MAQVQFLEKTNVILVMQLLVNRLQTITRVTKDKHTTS